MKKEQTNSWQKEFREEIIGHDDLNATEPYSVNEPIKGDIYFDGVAMEGFISNLISQEKEKMVEVAEKRASKERDEYGKTDFWYGMQTIIDLLQNK